MPRYSAPALLKAFRHLRTLTDRAQGREGYHIEALAQTAGVSVSTMEKAIRLLRENSLVHGTRSALHLSSHAAPGIDTVLARVDSRQGAPSRPKANTVADRLQRDLILEGFHGAERIPTAKELTIKYGVCHATLRQACRILVDSGTIEPDRRGYRVVSTAIGRRSSNRLILIGRGLNIEGGVSMLTARTQRMVTYLTALCRKLTVSLDAFGVFYIGTELTFSTELERILWDKETAGTILGFLFWPAGLSMPFIHAMLKRLNRLGRPVSVLDENAAIDGHVYGASRTGIFLTSAYQRAGRAVAQHLRDQGHRKVAYIAANAHATYTRNRLAGVVQVFGEVDHRTGVVPVMVSMGESGLPDRPAGNDLYLVAGKALSWAKVDGHHDDILNESLFNTGRNSLVTTDRLAQMRKSFVPLLQKQLEDTACTAWVCENDTLALLCRDFLLHAGKNIPRDIALAAFDDGPEAFAWGITSYNFDESALVNAMVDHVLHPGRARPGADGRVLIEGFVNVRGSTDHRRKRGWQRRGSDYLWCLNPPRRPQETASRVRHIYI